MSNKRRQKTKFIDDGRTIADMSAFGTPTRPNGSVSTSSWREKMRTYFEKMKKFTDAGYGVIIGEYGVCEKKDGTGMKPGHDQFAISVMEISKEFGYCPMLWDTGAWYDRTACTFKVPAVAEYLQSIQ